MVKVISIGRDSACEISIPDQSVSRNHAQIFISNSGRLYLIDFHIIDRNITDVSFRNTLIKVKKNYVYEEEKLQDNKDYLLLKYE